MELTRSILLPGSVLPAQPAYGALIEALGPEVHALAKDLELYAGDAPPPGWSLDTEVDGFLREAEARHWDTFHVVGYLLTVFPDTRTVVFPERNHFDPPHRIEPERLAASLRQYWERAEGISHAEL
ncbi:hypothetical protein [Arthrobacter silvisoli]|uniref:hypothetical protein n=1 Tax=Arthrobacter silvisoli TaxID=2291022 RepID=UPI000E20E7FA|nr:hypothetical protein [Arthrobacter silvisoli]